VLLEVLVRAKVVSMVPAAPLLPTTEPDSADVAQRVVPAAVVDVGGLDVLVLGVDGLEVVTDARVVEGAAVVFEVDGLEEHAPSSAPPNTVAAATPAILMLIVTVRMSSAIPTSFQPRTSTASTGCGDHRPDTGSKGNQYGCQGPW